MENFILYIKEPFFWAISLLSSLIISIVANILSPKIVRKFQAYTHAKTHKQKKKEAMFFGEVLILESNPALLTQAKLDAIYAFLLACFFLLIGIVTFLLSILLHPIFGWVPTAVAAIFGVLLLPIVNEVVNKGFRRIFIARAYERRATAIQQFGQKNNISSEEVFALTKEYDKKEFGFSIGELDSFFENGKPAPGSIP